MSEVDPIYNEIAGKMGAAESKAVPKLLQKIADIEQARLMLELPNTVEEITNKMAMDKAVVEKQLQYLYERGVVTPGKKGWNLITNLVLLKDFIGSASPKYDDNEVLDLAREMSLEDSENLAERLERGEEIPPTRQGMRVIPKWRSIKDIPGVLPIEDTREIFRDNAPLVIHRCPCRAVYRDRPCKDDVSLDVCIGTGKSGQRNLERGDGREVTYDELLAFLDKLDEFPLVTMTGNSNRMPRAICSCCNDCCGLFVRSSYTKPLLGQVAYAKSRFIVEDNPAECNSCGICTDNRCPVNAISMKEYPGLDGERAYTDAEECIGCGLCVLTCPTDARKMKLVRPIEHIPEFASIFDE